MLVLVIPIVLFSDIAFPLPFTQEQPGSQYIAWHLQPNERGSFGLIFNCIITLSLCVWTAIHLNVPAPKTQAPSSRLQRFRRSYSYTRFQWMLLGLLAPELAVYAAWRQWSSARLLVREMNKILLKKIQGKQEEFDDDSGPALQKWILIHGFYATMGGFVMDTYNPKVGEYIPGSPQLTLTAQGVLFLAENGFYLPYLTAESIRDRSKADGLAKSLVCLQAGYMIVQCSGRLAAKLPISLLEINTLGHVICTLIMYLFWLKKPQDIHEPSVVKLDGMDSVCAYAWMISSMSETSRGGRVEMNELCFYPRMDTSDSLNEISISAPSDGAEDTATSAHGNEDRESSTLPSVPMPNTMAVRVPPSQTNLKSRTKRSGPLPTSRSSQESAIVGENEVLLGSQLGPANAEEVIVSKKLVRARRPERQCMLTMLWEPARISLSEIDVRRWRLASAFLKRLQDRKREEDTENRVASDDEHSEGNDDDQGHRIWKPVIFRESGITPTYNPCFVMNAVPNWVETSGLLSSFEELPWIVISITTGLYGGLHATAWDSHFPSSAEHVLWCASCIIVAASGILMSLLITVDRLPQRLGWRPSESTSHTHSAIGYYFSDHIMGNWDILLSMVILAVGMSIALPAALAMLFYIPARLFLVEAFISLRNAPAETYITPDWTEWISYL